MSISADSISLMLSLIAIGGLIWRAATEQERLKSNIKDIRDDLQYKYDLELQKIHAELEKLEYFANSIREQLVHKSERYEREIYQLKAYLQKRFDFQTRRSRPNDDDDEPITGPL